VPDGTERDPPNPTYTCMVRMELKGWYINRKKNMQEGDRNKKEKKREQRQKERRAKRERELYRLPKKTIVVPVMGLQYTWGWIFLLYEN